MEKVNFTAPRIDGFKCDPGKQQTIHWDAKTPGLGLRVTAAGTKSYIFESRLHGKTLRITIGDARTWRLDGPAGEPQTARAEAGRLKSLIDQGKDPRILAVEMRAESEAKRIEATRHAATLGNIWPLYIEANKSTWGERHLADHVRLAAAGGEKRKRSDKLTTSGPIFSLFPVLLSGLNGERIAKWIKEESCKRPTSTAQSYRLLRAFIRWADGKSEYKGLIPASSYNAPDVRKAIPKNGVKDDCLQREQLKSWFDAVRKSNKPVVEAYLQCLLITGARREELLSLRWADVDFKWKSLTIRDKVEGTRMIPLTPFVESLLLELKRINETPPKVRQLRRQGDRVEAFKPSPWIFFSSTSANGRLGEPRAVHVRALELAGLPHLTLHGLRRSFGTLCEWVEVPTGISAQIMGHKPSALAEKHYRRRPIDLLRVWHEKIEGWILDQAGIEFKPAQNMQAIDGGKSNTAA